MIVVFGIFGQMVRKDAYLFSAEIGKSKIRDMSFIYSQYKYSILEIYKTANRKNYLEFADTCGK